MSFKEKLGENIKKVRIEKGYSQAELAKKLGVSQSAVYYWESGKREPNVDTIRTIAEILQVETSQLLDLKMITDNITDVFYQRYISETKIRKSALKALIEILEQLNIDGMHDLVEYAHTLTLDELYKSIYFNNDKMLTKIDEYTKKDD